MVRFLLTRFGGAVVLAFIVSTGTFFLLSTAGADPAAALLGIDATSAQIAVKRAELGLDAPLFSRYLDWLGGALTGNLGTSWSTNQQVASLVATRLPVTLSLAVGAILLSSVLGITLGYVSAIKRGWLDRALQFLVVIGYGLPGFWVALVLSTVFAVQLGWFPATGYTPFTQSPSGWAGTVILPIIALTLGVAASIAQQTRDSVLDVLRQGYVRTLRSRGLPHWRVLVLHVLRNAAAAPLGVISLQFIGLLGGAIMVENVFALPGLGTFAVSSSISSDVPAILGIVVVGAVTVVIVNLILDSVMAWLNPKVRTR